MSQSWSYRPELTDTVTSYISFCEDMCVKTKHFCTYNNNKPWFIPKLRQLCQAKEEAYRTGDFGLDPECRTAEYWGGGTVVLRQA